MPKLSLHVESKLRSELKERGDRCRRDTDWNQIGRADIAFLSRSALVKTYIDHGSQPSHFWYLPARIACGFIALCRRDSTAPGRAGLIASDATPRSTRGRAFFDYARWEAVPVAFKQAWRKRPTAYARPRSLYSTNFLYIQRRPSWRRQTLRFAELSRRRFQSDQSVCGDSNLGTRCVAALFNPVELQQTVERFDRRPVRAIGPAISKCQTAGGPGPDVVDYLVHSVSLGRCSALHDVSVERSHRAYVRRTEGALNRTQCDTEFSAPDHVARQLQSMSMNA